MNLESFMKSIAKAEEYNYVGEELLVHCIYTLGGQVIYNNLLQAGWRDFQEITKPLNVTEIINLVAKKKQREDAIFEREKQTIKVLFPEFQVGIVTSVKDWASPGPGLKMVRMHLQKKNLRN